jgi:hypothetical protein
MHSSSPPFVLHAPPIYLFLFTKKDAVGAGKRNERSPGVAAHFTSLFLFLLNENNFYRSFAHIVTTIWQQSRIVLGQRQETRFKIYDNKHDFL